MPIKFRCNYCRQFLGISRAQAGGIVDCPTCGRSIRVPQLDGSLQPLPQPELNLQDAHLARALEELARLGTSDSQAVSKPVDADEEFEEEDDENAAPQLIPEPIPIEVPIPPTPIAVNPHPNDDDDDQPPAVNGSQPVAPTASTSTNSLLEDLASIPQATPLPDDPAPAPRTAPTPVRRPFPSPQSIPQYVLMFALAFIVGMLFERFLRLVESGIESAPTPTAAQEKIEPVSQVTGRITYKSAEGTSQPDRGARIIAFPAQREGEAKLSVVGFRPADGEVDARFAAAGLKSLGGGMAIADDAGQFQLDLPAGTYQLLVLSHFTSRDEKAPLNTDLQKLMNTFFEKPDELLGRVQFHFGPLRVKGTGDVWDHSF